jgi:hypothetical protein
MPIQIIDNFDLNVAKPIDNRFVVGSQSFYTTKEQIPWKYAGMRIWDLNDSTPYVWTGTTYSSENTVSITGTGTINPNFLAKFSSVNQITISNIYDDGFNIGIGNTSPTYKLHVTGQVFAASGFVGNGSGITNINASNISSGYLGLDKIQLTPGGIGNILTHNGTSAIWTATSSISVENASQASKLASTRNIFGNSFDGTADVTGNIVFGGSTGKATIFYNQTTARTLTVPNLGGNRTFAFLEQAQTFTAANIFNNTLTVNISSLQRLNISSSGVSIGSGTPIKKMVVGRIDSFKNSAIAPVIYNSSGFTVTNYSHTVGASDWTVVLKINITGGVGGIQPIINASLMNIGSSGDTPTTWTLDGSNIETNFNNYSWGFYIRITIPNAETFSRVCFTYIEAV